MSINSSSGKYDLQRRKNFSSTFATLVLSISFRRISFPRFDSKTCSYFSSSIIKNSLPISTIFVLSISSKSSFNDAVSFLGFLIAAMNKFVSTKNRRMLFLDFFFDVTSHLANYRIDVDIFKVFLKLFRQFFNVYFFDYQKIVFYVCYEQLGTFIQLQFLT